MTTVNFKWQEPIYWTSGAVWFDFQSAETVKIEPRQVALIDTWTVVKVPEGNMLMLAPRSSTYKKLGLMMVNSVGIIDQDYCGENDTIKFQYINMTDEIVAVREWDRIWQGVLVKIDRPVFTQVENMEGKDRGWFGTTWL